MKKSELVFTTIIIVAILSGYSGIQHIFSLLSLGNDFGPHYPGDSLGMGRMISLFLLSVLFSACCIVLVKRGRDITGALLKNEPDEGIAQLPLDRRNLIFVLFIGIGLYTLVEAIPFAISDLIYFFKAAVGPISEKGRVPKKDLFIVELLRVILGMFMIYAAPVMTNFIDNKIAAKFGKNP
jgi:hypothetical protein